VWESIGFPLSKRVHPFYVPVVKKTVSHRVENNRMCSTDGKAVHSVHDVRISYVTSPLFAIISLFNSDFFFA
jgi:hypothetical protein